MRSDWKAEEPVSAGTKGEAMQTIPPKMWKMQRGQRRPYLHEMLVCFTTPLQYLPTAFTHL